MHLTFVFTVGTGTGKILKGAGQGLGHAFGGGKCKIIMFVLLAVSILTVFVRSKLLAGHSKLEKASAKASPRVTERR